MISIGLTCEFNEHPLAAGLAPRFSWVLQSERRNNRQTAYQIVCAAALEDLTSDLTSEKRLLWDSGKVASDQHTLITYEGSPLHSVVRYYWCVRVWDADGNVGDYSEPQWFETGPADSDWVASWITKGSLKGSTSMLHRVEGTINTKEDTDSQDNWALYFFTKIQLHKPIASARVYVSGLGYYELHINGRRVGDHVMDPGQTDYHKNALFSAYDITDLVQQNQNTFLLTVANGRHIGGYGYGNPKAILQAVVTFQDGSRETIVTDESWGFSYGPIHENGIYLGEIYDARDERLLKTHIDGESEAREYAEVTTGPQLRWQAMDPIRCTKQFQAVSMTQPRHGVYVYDFGQNLAGVIRMHVEGPEGSTVVLLYAELVGEDGYIDVGTNREASASDTYILKGEGVEIYQPRFTYHGFRYVAVFGYPGVPDLDSIQSIAVHTDAKKRGAFSCSNQLINEIHRICQWSLRSNLMSIPTDCPQRGERMGWLGDAQLASEMACYNLDMAAFYEKYLEDIRLSQRDDGSLSDVTPPYWKLYPSDPAWATAYATVLYNSYLYYNNKDVLNKHYPYVKKYVEFLASQADEGIIRNLGRYGDWCPPGSTYPKQTPTELTSTWYYYHDTLTLSRIAGLIGNRGEELYYQAKAEEIKEAFNKTFLTEGQYATISMSPIDNFPGQTSQTLPLYLDMVPEDQKQKVIENLKETIVKRFDMHVDTGIVGTRYIFEVLREHGMADIAYKMITQKSYPSWGYMIDNGATTVWERWEVLRGLGMNSHNHLMLGTVDAWFYRTIAGIIPVEAGWKTIRIAPHLFGGMTHASASVDTVNGRVSSVWQRVDGELKLEVEIPVGSTAVIYIPCTHSCNDQAAQLYEQGSKAKDAEGVLSVLHDEQHYVVEVGSGIYRFSLTDN